MRDFGVIQIRIRNGDVYGRDFGTVMVPIGDTRRDEKASFRDISNQSRYVPESANFCHARFCRFIRAPRGRGARARGGEELSKLSINFSRQYVACVSVNITIPFFFGIF